MVYRVFQRTFMGGGIWFNVSIIIIIIIDRFCGLVVGVLPTDPEVRVRFPEQPHFLRSSGSGTGSTQPCEYN
jgi:hypothetical protein